MSLIGSYKPVPYGGITAAGNLSASAFQSALDCVPTRRRTLTRKIEQAWQDWLILQVTYAPSFLLGFGYRLAFVAAISVHL